MERSFGPTRIYLPKKKTTIGYQMLKKIVISPTNTKAVAFFEELSKRKAETKKKIEAMAKDKLTKNKKIGE